MIRNSTIIPRKKQLSCGHFDYPFSKGRCKQCATIASTNKRVADHEKKECSESLQNLIDDMDAIFSRYIRLSYADVNGLVPCFTCPKKLPLAQMQNGHYISRANMATRFMEKNCKPQCPTCNSHHEVDETPFANKLESETPGITDWLKATGRDVYKYTIDEVKSLIAEYRFKVKVLEKKIQKR